MKVDISPETADILIVQHLEATISDLKADLQRREEGVAGSIFFTDQMQDIAEIIRHINAFETTLSYFGVPDEDI